MTVAENVAYGLTVNGMPKKQAAEKAGEGLKMVGLEGFGARLPSELSGGQQQRVAVARAVVLEPEVLLLDEPLSNLDAKLRRHVREEIRKIQQELNLTAVYVTHDQEEAMAVSDRIIVMKNAEIAQEGTPHDLYERPISAFIADFIGDSNLVDCDILSTDEASTEIRLGSKQIHVPIGTSLKGQAQAVLRPHHLRLDVTNRDVPFQGEVTYAAYLGNEIQYTVQGDFGELFVINQAVGQPISVGQTVGIDISIEDLRLVPCDA
ncbi:ABC transporter ATP-binding protein [uncultured Cohaesibacter sp.]|uniref:ABC transporter ATP-binding protein n=1 Tax=uncultured Cohaesibacter sp. TaxID=1002546 RepID=UPI00374992A1